MKKLLGILVLSLLVSNITFAKKNKNTWDYPLLEYSGWIIKGLDLYSSPPAILSPRPAAKITAVLILLFKGEVVFIFSFFIISQVSFFTPKNAILTSLTPILTT